MTYLIPVVYSMCGRIAVEADNLLEAFDKAEYDDFPLPKDADYLEDSFEVDYEGIVLDGEGDIVKEEA